MRERHAANNGPARAQTLRISPSLFGSPHLTIYPSSEPLPFSHLCCCLLLIPLLIHRPSHAYSFIISRCFSSPIDTHMPGHHTRTYAHVTSHCSGPVWVADTRIRSMAGGGQRKRGIIGVVTAHSKVKGDNCGGMIMSEQRMEQRPEEGCRTGLREQRTRGGEPAVATSSVPHAGKRKEREKKKKKKKRVSRGRKGKASGARCTSEIVRKASAGEGIEKGALERRRRRRRK